MVESTAGASTLTSQCHLPRITSEHREVGLEELESELLIQKTLVTRSVTCTLSHHHIECRITEKNHSFHS